MPEIITAIRRLSSRPILSEKTCLGFVSTKYSDHDYIYPLDDQVDFAGNGYSIIKVISVTEESHKEKAYSPYLYERYFLLRKNYILPLSKRIYKQGRFSEMYLYINSYNSYLTERGRRKVGPLRDRLNYRDPRRRLHLVPAFLSDAAVDMNIQGVHDPTDIDDIDYLSSDGWTPISELAAFTDTHYLGLFDAESPWEKEISYDVTTSRTSFSSRLKPKSLVDLGQVLSDLCFSLPLYEFKMVARPHHFSSTELEWDTYFIEYTCPITARLWGWHSHDGFGILDTPDYINKSDVDLFNRVLGDISIYAYEAQLDLSTAGDIVIYRTSNDVCLLSIRHKEDPSGPPLCVLTLDLAKAAVINPSFISRR